MVEAAIAIVRGWAGERFACRAEVMRLRCKAFKLWRGAAAVQFALGLFSCAGPIIDVALLTGERESSPSSAGANFVRCPSDDRPLPYAGHWNTGQLAGGFAPSWQVDRLKGGQFLWPWLYLPPPTTPDVGARDLAYYESAIRFAASQNLPISFVSTQWESLLTDDERYVKLAAAENPNVVTADGKIQPEVSPFGTATTWGEAGKQWTDRELLRRIQQLYPVPPLVLFVSNNEQVKLRWQELERDARSPQHSGKARDPESRKRTVGDRFITLYNALQGGMRDGLSAPVWKERSVFIGYNAIGPRSLGRWADWSDDSLQVRSRFDPQPFMWDGASASYYSDNWSGITDYTVWSSQIEAMNWVFMQREAERINPCFFLELSTWDGHMAERDDDKRKFYESKGQSFNPQRYEGFVQFGMWLLRPRIVREFRGWRDTVTNSGAYFEAIERAVARVHTRMLLREFWHKGQLVVNPEGKHPYQIAVPAEVEEADRWFLLDTDLHPPRPWSLNTEIPVFSLALKHQVAGRVHWLVYAHAPLGDRIGVGIRIPGYGWIKMDVHRRGSFSVLDGETGRISAVSD